LDDVRIVEAQPCYVPGHTATISEVAREGLYLSNNTGFSYEAIFSFYQMCLAEGYPQFYVINSEDRAVGWYDIVPRGRTGRKVGYIGLGLRADYRDRGIGTRMMLHAIEHAPGYGFTELRLECRASNKRALHVYEKLGFHRIGYKRSGLILDGEKIPVVYMKRKLDCKRKEHDD